MEIWRHWADDVTGSAIDSGQFMVEERPVQCGFDRDAVART